jgi:anthranilate synthase component II
LYKNKALRVLLIDNYDSFTHNIVSLLNECGVDDVMIVKNDQIDFDVVENFDKIIISPGPKIPLESGQIIELIQRFAPTKNILGICLGHQAIAEAFGATLYQLPHPQHGAQIPLQIIGAHSLYKNIPQNTIVGLYHSWAVNPENLPTEFLVTAINLEDVIMSIKHKTLSLHGVQFHPESYITKDGKKMMENWLAE